jgi:A/G-specific adenine glycosylase
MPINAFAERLLDWHDRAGRKDLPWQQGVTPYRVWVSEVMLQQTQVATVIPYFERFMARYPGLTQLASAALPEVLSLWAGLGYYARARNLHRAAVELHASGATELPTSFDELLALPGIGRSTAAAILALSRGERHAILDGNVKRVLARHRGIAGWPGESAVATRLWDAAETFTPEHRVAAYTQAMMDLGAMVCSRSRPRCEDCPVASDCIARLDGRIADLPALRPRKPLPERSCWVLLLEDDQGRVWLEERPPVGIWGGLNSLPEYPTGTALEAACEAMSAVTGSTLPAIEHVFTHFRLRLTPVTARITTARIMEPQQGLWYKPGEAADRPALPAPIARLLDGLAQTTPTEGRTP